METGIHRSRDSLHFADWAPHGQNQIPNMPNFAAGYRIVMIVGGVTNQVSQAVYHPIEIADAALKTTDSGRAVNVMGHALNLRGL